MIRRLLKLLFVFNVYNKHYVLRYDGEVISFNKLYSGGHWSKRSGYKNRFSKIFTLLCLEANVQPMKEMFLVVFYNTRHDADNIVLSAKFLMDAMKGTYIVDDSSKYYKGIQVTHDPDLPKGMLEFHICGKA
jgi:hypothetical protein